MANVSSFSGAFPVIPGGMVELGYSAITTPGTVTSITAGTGTEIIAPLTVACDGSPIMVEFYSPAVQAPVSGTVGGTVNISLFQDGSENIRFWGQQNAEAFSGQQNPVHLQARLTPTAGTHSFGVKGYLNTTGTAVVSAGNGSSTGTAPAFLRVSKVLQQNDGLKPFWNPPVTAQLPTRANTGDQVIRLNNGVYEPHQYIDSTTGWKYLGNSTIICTSSTRPASPFEGQTIYETDTDKFLVYNGSAWYPPWNQPWGIVARGQATGNQSGITTATDLTNCSVTFTAVSGRLYKTSGYSLVQQVTSNGRIALAISDGSNSWKQEAQEYMPVNEYGHLSLYLYESGLSGSVTRKLRMLTTAGSCSSLGSSASPTQIIVEDIGPA